MNEQKDRHLRIQRGTHVLRARAPERPGHEGTGI